MTMTHSMPVAASQTWLVRYRRACIGSPTRIPLSLVQLAGRVAVAHVFWQSAQTKLASWPVTLQLFAFEYKLPIIDPAVAAPLATAAELIGAVLLFFGLFARLGALMLLGVVATIQIFVYPGHWARASPVGVHAAPDPGPRRRRRLARPIAGRFFAPEG